jgi:formiminotetrahydrofolate cyclodeaminase
MPEQILKEEIDFLTLPTNELLEKFGQGRHIPGSGSAAAFSGLLAVELMKTVCKLTISRSEDKYVAVRREFTIILELLETETKPKLIRLFQKDITVFNGVSQYRTARDQAKKNQDEREERRFSRLETEKLKEATEIPLEIAQTCLSVVDYAFTIFDRGFQSAKGDSGVAISNLLSAVSGSLFVTLINIKTAKSKKTQWIEKLREDAEIIGNSYNSKQKIALSKVFELYKEGIDIQDYQLKLDFE